MSDGLINIVDDLGRILIYKKWRLEVGINPGEQVEISKKGDILYIKPCDNKESKTSSMIKKVDSLGRIVIPKKLRKELNICPNTPLEVCKENGMIRIQVKSDSCCICGEKPNRSEVFLNLHGKIICKLCSEKIAEMKYGENTKRACAI